MGTITLLKQRGNLAESRFFAVGRTNFESNWKTLVKNGAAVRNSSNWPEFLNTNNIRFCNVDPSVYFPKDPTDEAIKEAVRTLLPRLKQDEDVIALMTSDRGFAPLVQEVVESGYRCMAVLSKPALHLSFQEVGADIVDVSSANYKSQCPKFKVVLNADGQGSIAAMTRGEMEYCKLHSDPSEKQVRPDLASHLCTLGFLE